MDVGTTTTFLNRVQSRNDPIDLLQARDDIAARRRGLVEVDQHDPTLRDGSDIRPSEN